MVGSIKNHLKQTKKPADQEKYGSYNPYKTPINDLMNG